MPHLFIIDRNAVENNSTTTSADASAPPTTKLPIAAMAGGAGGGVLLALLLVVLWMQCRRARQTRPRSRSQSKVLVRRASTKLALAPHEDNGRPSTSSSLSPIFNAKGANRESFDNLATSPVWSPFDEKRTDLKAGVQTPEGSESSTRSTLGRQETIKFESKMERAPLLTQKLSSATSQSDSTSQYPTKPPRSILKPAQSKDPRSDSSGVYKISSPRTSPRRLRHLTPQSSINSLRVTHRSRPNKPPEGARDATQESVNSAGRFSIHSRSRILPRVDTWRLTKSSFMTSTSASVYSEPDPIGVAHGGEDIIDEGVPEDIANAEAVGRYLEFSEQPVGAIHE